MDPEQPLEKRHRKYRSLRNSVDLRVQLSPRAKAILAALRNRELQQVGYGAVLEELLEPHAALLGADERDLVVDPEEQEQ